MKKVITYGTYDLLHYGHIRLLERAKALGDYLIVGITADDFDKKRGKINVQQSLVERIDAVKAIGIADEIIVEEYEGQKIDDIIKYGVDVFTVGSDWVGVFDYLKEYCEVVYLERTEGVSSSTIRDKKQKTKLGVIGEAEYLEKFLRESHAVNGVEISGICTHNADQFSKQSKDVPLITNNFYDLLEVSDAIYITSHPSLHESQIRLALSKKKHVLCESPISLSENTCSELFAIADKQGVVLTEALKTAYSTAYSRLLLLLKGGVIGDVISVDATCTSLSSNNDLTEDKMHLTWNSICSWGPPAMLPVFQILGTDYISSSIVSKMLNIEQKYDLFTKIDFTYPQAVASVKAGKGVKSEGELIVSGTKGYIYVPSPWWKTDYFEVRYENATDNKRYFYHLEGEGIRDEIAAFVKTVNGGKSKEYISRAISLSIARMLERFYEGDYYILGSKE